MPRSLLLFVAMTLAMRTATPAQAQEEILPTEALHHANAALAAGDRSAQKEIVAPFLAKAVKSRLSAEEEMALGELYFLALNPRDSDAIFMPEHSGLRVLERMTRKPAIVFVTAYDQYAITAFELEAVDYLVKPFGTARFAQTLRRIQEHFQSRPAAAAQAPRGENVDLTRLFLRKRHDIVPVLMTAVSRLAAEGDYTRVFVAADHYLSSMSLGEFERRLDPRRFVRVHRSLIINLDYVRSVHPVGERRLNIRMTDGFEAAASRTGSERLRALFA